VADEFHWWQAVLAGLGGGSIVKAVDIVYLEIRRLREGSRTATRFVDEHLDPLLKASDELVGKLLALGKEDFRSLRLLDSASTLADSNELGGLVFLFAPFWAQIEIIKREGLSVAISQYERGRHLENFLDCLESTRVRLVDRTAQRALGETVLEARSGKLQTVAYIEFIRRSPEPEIASWVDPIRAILVRGWHTAQRQKLLQYGLVLHALIDTLDTQHVVTRNRPGLPGKLSRQTWRDLNLSGLPRLFAVCNRPQKIFGPPALGRPRLGRRREGTFWSAREQAVRSLGRLYSGVRHSARACPLNGKSPTDSQ
jgi:hypothetical protein